MIPNNPNISTPGPKGRWMECVAAGEILNVKSMKKMKSLGVQHMSFERGDKVGALYPYSKFEFVYSSPGALSSWLASSSYSITLAQWCNLCLYFSSNDDLPLLELNFSSDFLDYTGPRATVSNIQWAFAEKLLISPDTLEEKLKEKEASRKGVEKILKKTNKQSPPKSKVSCGGVQSPKLD